MGMQLIETIEVGAPAASIEFTAIPQDGVDLLLVYSIRVNWSGDETWYSSLRFNSSTTGYSWRTLNGNGSGAYSSSYSAQNSILVRVGGNSATANTFGNGQIYLPNYTSSTVKSVSNEHVSENNATTARQEILAGTWSGTSGIDTITISSYSAILLQYSTASLYKITAD